YTGSAEKLDVAQFPNGVGRAPGSMRTTRIAAGVGKNGVTSSWFQDQTLAPWLPRAAVVQAVGAAAPRGAEPARRALARAGGDFWPTLEAQMRWIEKFYAS